MAPATATLTSKFDRAAIMRAAWSHYRSIRERYADWQIERGIIDGSFANALRIAWMAAKKEAAEVEKAQRLWNGPNAERAAAIRQEIDLLMYKSLQINIAPMRAKLEAELAALAA